MDKTIIEAMVRALSNDEVRKSYTYPCPSEVGLRCQLHECAEDCKIGISDVISIGGCWRKAIEGTSGATPKKKKKKKMDKVTKDLMKYATDGGRKTAYFCPVDAGFDCPELGPFSCTHSESKKRIRKCWKIVYNSQEE